MGNSSRFLTQVIFQANFNIESLKKSIDEQLALLCERATSSTRNIGANTSFNFDPQKGNAAQIVFTNRYLFKNDIMQIILQSELLQIIIFKYNGHEEFHAFIETIFNKVKEVYSPIFTRVALRYVNNVNFPTGDTYDFDQFITPSLLAATNDFKSFGLTRSIGVMNMADDEQDILANFTYGFVNSLFPNKIAKREFILDYDCYTNLKTAIDAIKPMILKLRNKANELFNKSILPALKTEMSNNGQETTSGTQRN